MDNVKKILMDIMKLFPDKVHLQIMYFYHFHKFINFKNPKTYNEKLQWLKIHDRNPEYTLMVDKYHVRNYISNKIGDQYLIPLLGKWENAKDINFKELPERFVLKCNHDSKSVIICKDKSKLDVNKTVEKLNYHLKNNPYYYGREWPYKNVKPCIIAEKYMEDDILHDLRDYKFYCFDGKVRIIVINSNRNDSSATTGDFFDRDFKWLDFTWGFKNAEVRPSKPEKFDEMVQIAETLSNGLIHVRIDLYECNHKVYFGEITFYDGSGFDSSFNPVEWDEKLGEYIKLPVL